MAVAPYATPLEKTWYYTFRVLCGLIFFFLMAPILIIIPLGFNSIPFFTYPMEGFSFRWYGEIFGDSPISILWQRSILNSVIVAVCATLLATTLGTLAALGLTRANFPFKSLVMAILISPIIVPIVVTAIGMFYFYAQIGLASTLKGIILAHTALGVPFVVITVSATLAGFDYNMLRAGAILGANPITVFRKVTLPIITPGLASGGLFAFATSWDEVVVVLFLASTEQHTVPRRMWSGIRELLSPTIIAAATLLIIVSIALMLTMEWLRRRSERMRGVTPA
ncbi:MAG: polyamine ABC transporter permease [Thiotrichales bacterium]|nr:polyamine ABC transporter permease [Thiotrichales bacterium]